MPSLNQLKDYQPGSYYHIYNRGTNSMDLFRAGRDYDVFLEYLRLILSSPQLLHQQLEDARSAKLKTSSNGIKQLENAIIKSSQFDVHLNVELLSFCLMPNHFHLLVFQKDPRGIERLMRRLASGFTGYFRRVNQYRGPLFESRYKASHMYYEPEVQALVAARYIERNPIDLMGTKSKIEFNNLLDYPYSSLLYYYNYKKKRSLPWLKTRRLKKVFWKIKSSPNGIIEKEITQYDNYYNFVVEENDISLEDVKLDHTSRIA